MDLRLSTLLVYLAAYMLVACLAVCIGTTAANALPGAEQRARKSSAVVGRETTERETHTLLDRRTRLTPPFFSFPFVQLAQQLVFTTSLRL